MTKLRFHRTLMLIWLALIGLGGVGLPLTQGQVAAPEVIVLEATGPVVPPFASYVERGLKEADERNAEAIIIQLDTPGGSVDTTLDIVQAMRASDVPVIVYVGPRGARAASAGLLITLAGHAAAMAPETAIGASSPVGPQGEDLDSTLEAKAKESISAQARSLAERRGADAVALANDAVMEARAVSASEALAGNLVDFIASDIDDLLSQLDGFEVEVNGRSRTLRTSGAMLDTVPMSWLEEFLIIVTNPTIVFTLLSFGVTAIIIEIRTPGGWAAGTIGVICVGLALYGLGVMPVNWLGIIFIILAFVLFILDIKAPTHGALTAAAIASLIAGALILFNAPEVQPFGRLSIPIVILDSAVVGAFFFFVIAKALQIQARRPTTGYEGLIGQVGKVVQDIDPSGMVIVWGERWKAVSDDGTAIPQGAEIEVVEANQMRLRVRPVTDDRVGRGDN